ncbi:hypothetical protein AT01_1262 [Yersinia aldovae 670-83]|nr:hypothetical protein AT01_1262 [Yersinia aldovae 670-83]
MSKITDSHYLQQARLPRDAFYVDSLMFTVLTTLHLPDCGCQEDTPLTICIPRIRVRFVTLSDPLLYSGS